MNKDWRGYVQLVGANARRMQQYIDNQDALLFLQSSQPQLLAGLPAEEVAALRRISWEHFGPIAQQLVQGATNWTVAPAPCPSWAHTVYADLPSEQRLPALWETVFESMRIPGRSATSGRAFENPPGLLRQGYGAHAKPTQPAIALATAGGRVPPTYSSIAAWHTHLHSLQQRCSSLNAQKHRTLRYKGDGTDLTVTLPPGHVWCTALLTTKAGVPFVANLPTEELFTAPHRDSAEGTVRVSRSISHGGSVIAGIELQFKRGRVVAASAQSGADLLARMLDTDEGASRLGEVAIVPGQTSLGRAGRLFYHPLLDENAHSHIALGEAYRFCQRPPDEAVLNRSLVHVDLPVDARIILPGTEPS